MDSKKLINIFEMEKRIGHLVIYSTIIVFGNLLITFWYYYYGKYMFLTSIMKLIIFRFLLYREFWNFDRIKLLAGSVYVKHP